MPGKSLSHKIEVQTNFGSKKFSGKTNYQAKSIKQNLQNQIYQAKCLKCEESNILNQMKYIKQNLFNQNYKTKSTKPVLDKPNLKEIKVKSNPSSLS